MRLVSASALLALAASGCGQPVSEAPGDTRQALRIQGSDTTTRDLLPALGSAWEKQRPDVMVEISGGGSSAGLRALLAGEADLAATSRAPLPIEEEQARADGPSARWPGKRRGCGRPPLLLQGEPLPGD